VNLLVALKQAGFRVREVPIEWTDVVGSKVTSSLFRSAFTMFLSVWRIRLIYWPTLYACCARCGRWKAGLQKAAAAAAVVPLDGAKPAAETRVDRPTVD